MSAPARSFNAISSASYCEVMEDYKKLLAFAKYVNTTDEDKDPSLDRVAYGGGSYDSNKVYSVNASRMEDPNRLSLSRTEYLSKLSGGTSTSQYDVVEIAGQPIIVAKYSEKYVENATHRSGNDHFYSEFQVYLVNPNTQSIYNVGGGGKWEKM